MVPTFMLIGFLIGFLPRPWYLAGIVIAAIGWPLLRVVSGDAVVDGPSMAGEFALAAANAAAGAVIARLLINAVRGAWLMTARASASIVQARAITGCLPRTSKT